MEAWSLGPDPGDRALLELAAMESRVLITIDTDFGELVYRHDVSHAGLLRLPDVPAEQRIALVTAVIDYHGKALENPRDCDGTRRKDTDIASAGIMIKVLIGII